MNFQRCPESGRDEGHRRFVGAHVPTASERGNQSFQIYEAIQGRRQ